MKKYFIILTLLFGSLSAVKAQSDQPPVDDAKKQEKIQALYVAYITQQLELSPEEAQKFWPVHAQFQNEIKGVNPDMPVLDKQQAVLNIKKRYQENFNRILGPKKCERFFKMDGEFRHKLLERIRKQNDRPKFRRVQ